MRVLVAGSFFASSERAHAINTVKMAQGFARCGCEVLLVCRTPPGGGGAADEFHARFGIAEELEVVQLPAWTGESLGFALAALPTVRRFRPDLVFARNYLLPWLTSRLGVPTAAESHAHPGNRSWPFRALVGASRHRAFRLWVTIADLLADHYRSLGVPGGKLVVLPDAVDLELFRRPADLPPSPFCDPGPRAVYAGHLYDYKGIPTILAAAVRLREVQFHLLGGLPEDVERQRRRVAELGLPNVTLHGWVPHARVPGYLWHADVLLLPPSAAHPSALWTSPVKLGEYLAAGVPVVATDIPALRNWLSDQEARFVPPDDPAAMAAAIEGLLRSPERAAELASKGFELAEALCYNRRARRILELSTSG